MQFWMDNINAFAVNETFSETLTIDLPATDVLVTCGLQQVGQLGSNGQAQIAITQYVQDGSPKEGSWQSLSGNVVTSVTFSLTANNARAQGTALVLALRGRSWSTPSTSRGGVWGAGEAAPALTPVPSAFAGPARPGPGRPR